MPSTVNGIGTSYYGKTDAAGRIGNCQFCGTNGRLETYTTRLWFVIFFIPIIPLKRVRLLDYCSRCSRHWVANPEQYEMSRQLAVSGALEKYRDAPSVEAALVVHAQLLSFHMHPEADQFRQTALETYPASAELRSGFAIHLDQTGRWMEATELYEAAFQLKSELPEVRNSLAWRRMNENKLDEAFELLDFLRKPGAGQSFNLGLLEQLASAYQKAGKHERTLEICEHLLQEFPAAGNQYAFRKLISKSERELNRSVSILPPRSASIRGLFDSKSGTHAPWVRWAAFGSVAMFLFLVGMAGLNEYRRGHRTLYVVNGFAQPVGISIDGAAPVSVTSRTPIALSEGKHRVNVTGPVTKQHEFEVQSSYWTRWTYKPVWVFNVENSVALVESTVRYAAVPQPASYKWLGQTEFNSLPHIDYVFEQPPQRLTAKGNNGVITKMHVGTVPYPITSTYLFMLNRADQSAAWAFAEGHLNRPQFDPKLLDLYCQHATAAADVQRVTEFLKMGLWRKPISVPWHREYQRLKTVIKDEPALAAEYDVHLKDAPDDASLLYLRGRVSPTVAEEIKFYLAAQEKNPQLGWPAMGIAYRSANRGDWKEAREWCDKANAIKSDSSFRAFWHVVRLANQDFGAMEMEYRQLMKGEDFLDALYSMFYLADVLAVQQKYDEARQAAREWIARHPPSTQSAELTATAERMLDYLSGELERFRRVDEATKSKGQSRFQFYLLLAAGEPDAAVEIVDDENDDWASTLAISLAYSLIDNRQEAEKWLTKTCELLRQGDSDANRAADLLQRHEPPTVDELDEIVLSIAITPLYVATLARRFPDRGAELKERAQRLSISRMHPYLLVKRALEAP